MKNKISLIFGIVFLALSVGLGFLFGTTFVAALTLETGVLGLLSYVIPLLLIVLGFFEVRALSVVLILVQIVLYANNFIFGVITF